MKIGFDNKKYLKLETEEIKKRLKVYEKIYLEFGGHLTYDGHASRVLPGYDPKNKLKIIKLLKDVAFIYCVNAKDINSKKLLGDFELNYEEQTLKDLNDLKKNKLPKPTICITRYRGEKKAKEFGKRLEQLGYRVFFHLEIPNYLTSTTAVLNGYEKNPYIPEDKKIVIVTGAAGGSGKMATALCQMYKERKMGVKTGYAKIESFPVWNLPINHPVNIAYEAATADLGDKIEIDPYHLKFYKKKAVNYNRDIENFKILKKIANKLFSKEAFPYKSPTDMGINMIKFAITDYDVCRKAGLEEIKRREKEYEEDYKNGRQGIKTIKRMKEVLKKVKQG